MTLYNTCTCTYMSIKLNNFYFVLIRSHIEFQLNTEPSYPFWFTPAQLAGRLIITKDASHIEYFEMSLPTKNALNIGLLSNIIDLALH